MMNTITWNTTSVTGKITRLARAFRLASVNAMPANEAANANPKAGVKAELAAGGIRAEFRRESWSVSDVLLHSVYSYKPGRGATPRDGSAHGVAHVTLPVA